MSLLMYVSFDLFIQLKGFIILAFISQSILKILLPCLSRHPWKHDVYGKTALGFVKRAPYHRIIRVFKLKMFSPTNSYASFPQFIKIYNTSTRFNLIGYCSPYTGKYKNTLEDLNVTSTPEGSIITIYSTPTQSTNLKFSLERPNLGKLSHNGVSRFEQSYN